MSQVQEDASLEHAPATSVRERVADGLRGLFRRVEHAGDSLAAGAAKGRERAAGAAGSLRRGVPLRHGLAAIERGNLEAALALLREAAEQAPHDEESVLAFWNVALSCERPELAAPALAGWIHVEASSGRRDVAAEHWTWLAEQVPDQRLDAPTLVRLLPELRRRVTDATGAEERSTAEAWLRRALRSCVQPGTKEMTTGLALRVFEQARFVDARTARLAGKIVLSAKDLHDNKRRHVEELLARLESGDEETAAADPAPVRDVCEATPVELSERGLIVRAIDGGRRTRVDLRSVEALSVALVDGLGGEPVLVVDLVLRRVARERPRRIFRLRADAFDADAVISDHAPSEDPLRGLLGALLDRSGAVPLPDPDSALGIEPRHFPSLEAYESAVLDRIGERR